jgi:four helix bundle protein
MGDIKNFTDLVVWQRAMDLIVAVYQLTDKYPQTERFGLTAHSRKTAISIASNIAEGCCRSSRASYINHVHVALGSEGELYTQLECGRRLGFAPEKELQHCLEHLSATGKMLRNLARALERSHSA